MHSRPLLPWGKDVTAAQTSLIPVIEAVEWREAARGGGSQPQVFRLSDGRFAIVKFPENPQGEHVLANDYLCCKLAGILPFRLGS